MAALCTHTGSGLLWTQPGLEVCVLACVHLSVHISVEDSDFQVKEVTGLSLFCFVKYKLQRMFQNFWDGVRRQDLYYLIKHVLERGCKIGKIQCQKWSLGSLLETYLIKIVVCVVFFPFFPLLITKISSSGMEMSSFPGIQIS